LPHSGQDFPTNSLSDGIVGAGVAEEAFFREVPAFFFGCLTVEVVAVFSMISVSFQNPIRILHQKETIKQCNYEKELDVIFIFRSFCCTNF
jgi:hypothetical protein